MKLTNKIQIQSGQTVRSQWNTCNSGGWLCDLFVLFSSNMDHSWDCNCVDCILIIGFCDHFMGSIWINLFCLSLARNPRVEVSWRHKKNFDSRIKRWIFPVMCIFAGKKLCILKRKITSDCSTEKSRIQNCMGFNYSTNIVITVQKSENFLFRFVQQYSGPFVRRASANRLH